MNPYSELGIKYDEIERKGLNEEIRESYEQKKQEYKTVIDEIYMHYPNLPQKIEELKNIDLIEILKEIGEKIEFSEENIRVLKTKCEELKKAVTLLIETNQKQYSLDRAYRMIQSVYSRLVFLCEKEKIKKGCSLDLVKKVENKPVEINKKPIVINGERISEEAIIDVDLGDSTMQHMGRLGYINWTGVCQSYINKYVIKKCDGESQPIYTNIPNEYKNDPKFVEFLKTIMLNEEYIDYAIQNNGGYIGSPREYNGNYKIEFNNEDLVAVQKYCKDKSAKEDKESKTEVTSEYKELTI